MAPFLAFVTSLLFLVLPGPGWLGVFLADDPAAVVDAVVPGSPAEKAGIEKGDRIVAVGDQAITDGQSLVTAIGGHPAGTTVKLKVLRGDQKLEVAVTLAERPADRAATPTPTPTEQPTGRRPAPAGESRAEGARAYLGIGVEATDDGLAISRVVDGGPAAAAGVRAGERIRKFGEHAIGDEADLQKAMAARRPGDKVALQLQGEDGAREVVVVLGSVPGAGAGPGPGPGLVAREARPGEPAGRDGDMGAALQELRNEVSRLRAEVAELRERLARLQAERGKE